MNNKQLLYIKEQQEKNRTYILPTVRERNSIDDNIIKELDTLYNPSIEGLETEFSDNLHDLTLPHTFLNTSQMFDMIRTYGSDALLIYIDLHTKMCPQGYRIDWDDLQKNMICATIGGLYHIEPDTILKIVEQFIVRHLLYRITDGKTEYLTSTYQVFAYERVKAKRLRDRIAKRNSKIKKKEEKLKTSTELPVLREEETISNSAATNTDNSTSWQEELLPDSATSANDTYLEDLPENAYF